MTTPEQLTELRRLLAEATTGQLESGCNEFGVPCVYNKSRSLAMKLRGTKQDAQLIAAAVNALPSLLDAAEREQKLREALLELCRDYEVCSATVYDKATGQSLIELTRPAIQAARSALKGGAQ